jgi:hypothetical protein
MDPATMQVLATLGSGLFGALFGGKGQQLSAEQRGMLDAQRRGTDVETALNRLKLARQQAQDPIWRAVQSMAFSRLPIFAKRGFNLDLSQPVNGQALTPGQVMAGSRPHTDEDVVGRAQWK